jgi:hypothetical protein
MECRHATLVTGPGGAERTTSLEEEEEGAEGAAPEGVEGVTQEGSTAAHSISMSIAAVAAAALLALA